MKIEFMGVQKNWTVCGLLGFFLFFSFGNSYFAQNEFGGRENPSVVPIYDRIDDVKRECKLVYPSGSVLKPNDNRAYGIEKELSFVNGDWDQENGKSPLLPFNARGNGDSDRYRLGTRYSYPYSERNVSVNRSPVNLFSFWVTDVDRDHKVKDSIGVNAVVYMGKTIDGSFMERPYDKTPQFHMYPGHSELSVVFQGIYMESEGKNGGERVLCLLGSALLPSRKSDDSSSDPWDWTKDSDINNDQPSVLQDDQVLLILRYPKKLTLTSMEIQGEMRSLNQKSSLKYFDKVKISSQLGSSATYKFVSNELVSKACDPYPYEDKLRNTEIDIYKGKDFCSLLKQFTQGEAFVIVPNWKCNSTKEMDCNKLGPFGSTDEAINATKGGFKDVKLSMQKVRCEKNSDGLNKVSAVFRAISPSENVYYAQERTGLSSNMTLPVEGIWKESSGQLCMIGCVADRCDSRICLYIPISFSIKQRSIIAGSFSSINNTSPSYFPLQFEKVVQPNELWDRFQSSHFHYKYTKIDLAGTVLEKYESFTFSTVIKSSLLTFPKLEDQVSYLSSPSFLFEDLTLQTTAVLDPVPRSTRALGTELKLEIVSIGPIFGQYWSSPDGSTPEDVPYHTKAEYTVKELLLNVSAQLSLTGKPYANYSLLFLEGIYDPRVGKLFTIGCRDVRASQEILFDSMDLEDGLDCLTEVVISYPPTTSRWLVNPTARISIKSQRNQDDPLYFNSTDIQTLPIMYRRQREDILSRKGVEGMLRSLTLSLAIACILSQLWYIAANTEPVPYMSLVMLGVQAMGYSLPLVTGAEALFKKTASDSDHMTYNPESNQWFHVIEYTVKFLVLVTFLLTLRLCQKVWKSRARLLARTNQESQRLVPTDKKVFFSTFALHLIGYLTVLALHRSTKRSTTAPTNNFGISYDNSGIMWGWAIELEEYIGLVQDFFLLPQIIGNFIWAIDCKPIRKVYYIGITIVRLLPHVYDYIRDPVPNPYFSEDYEFVNPNLDFFSRFGDIAIPATAVLLAVIVFIQQRWSYEKLSETLKFRGFRILPMGSKMYQRLPTKVFETELASGVNEDTKRVKDRDDED